MYRYICIRLTKSGALKCTTQIGPRRQFGHAVNQAISGAAVQSTQGRRMDVTSWEWEKKNKAFKVPVFITFTTFTCFCCCCCLVLIVIVAKRLYHIVSGSSTGSRNLVLGF